MRRKHAPCLLLLISFFTLNPQQHNLKEPLSTIQQISEDLKVIDCRNEERKEAVRSLF